VVSGETAFADYRLEAVVDPVDVEVVEEAIDTAVAVDIIGSRSRRRRLPVNWRRLCIVLPLPIIRLLLLLR